jgi:hypothetical protein
MQRSCLSVSVALGVLLKLGAAGAVTFPQAVTENQRFQPADRATGDLFSYDVAVDGARAIITAPRGDVGGSRGSAYVYEQSGAGLWTQTAELGPLGATASFFGGSVDLEGNFAVVGAADDNTLGVQAGAAYVFERTGGGWTQVAKLLAADGAQINYFGCDVAISGDQIIVGAFGHNGSGAQQGAAYIFSRQASGVWSQTAKLQAALPASNSEFGVTVDLDGDRAVIGAPNDGTAGLRSGAAYVFDKLAGGMWMESEKLTLASPTNLDAFGFSVSLTGDLLAVGAPRTPQGNNTNGSAHIFQATGAGDWTLMQRLDTDYAQNNFGDFGRSVAITEEWLVIGAEDHNLAADWNGAAYLYSKSSGGQWTSEKALLGTASVDGRFGSAVALDGLSVFVGARRVQFESGLAYYFNVVPEPSAKLLAVVGVAYAAARRGALVARTRS